MKDEIKDVDQLYVSAEVYEVGKVNGVCYKIIELLRTKEFEDQMLIYSMILEKELENSNG